MLAQADFERALALALGEFAPAWEIVGGCAPIDPLDPTHWGTGSRSFQVTLRHRVTGHLKVLGRRVAHEPNESLHPAVALSPIGAYRHGNTEPIRRYLEEIGVASTPAGDAATFFRQPSLALSPAATKAVTATPALESRGRVLRRLRRELAIWQWRRSAGGADLGINRTRE